MAGHGGARKGAGRKSKSEELKVQKIGLESINRIYGSIEAYYDFLAEQGKESFNHLKLLHEYVFGKPIETVVNLNSDVEKDELTDDMIKSKIKDILNNY
jgi:hypothetical protein